ncbi:MAG: sulfate permease [Myxococcota bacterium]
MPKPTPHAATPALRPSTLERLIPAVGWMRRYQRADLRGDLTAGVTTAVLLAPQAMAYATLAGLPPVVGLYAATLPLAVYALFGTSRQLAVGPVATDSLLVAAIIGGLAVTGGLSPVALAATLALMVGALQLAMGSLRMGFLANFLSQPVLSGFTSAVALVIALSQAGPLLGLSSPAGADPLETARALLAGLPSVHPAAAIVGLGSLIALSAMRRLAPRAPRALVVVVAATVFSVLFDLHSSGVPVVGAVPSGLPTPDFSPPDAATATALLPGALTLAFIGFIEAISVGRALAARHGYRIAPNREFTALGLANLAGGLTGGYPIAGGFSRSAVNNDAGARTPLASLVTAALMLLVLLFLTPLLHDLPRPALAAIIASATATLIDTRIIRFLWRVKRSDLGLLVLTFAATLVVGIQEGILIGVTASVLWFVVRSTRPHTAILGQLPGTESYRNLDRFPEARRIPGMTLVRVDAPFYFGNVTFLRDTVARLREECPERLRALVIDATSINELDSSAATALFEIADEADTFGFELYFAGAKGPVRDVMQRSGFWERVGHDRFYLRVHEAVTAARRNLESRDAISEADPCDPPD